MRETSFELLHIFFWVSLILLWFILLVLLHVRDGFQQIHYGQVPIWRDFLSLSVFRVSMDRAKRNWSLRWRHHKNRPWLCLAASNSWHGQHPTLRGQEYWTQHCHLYKIFFVANFLLLRKWPSLFCQLRNRNKCTQHLHVSCCSESKVIGRILDLVYCKQPVDLALCRYWSEKVRSCTRWGQASSNYWDNSREERTERNSVNNRRYWASTDDRTDRCATRTDD